jgi:hypothetical protein
MPIPYLSVSEKSVNTKTNSRNGQISDPQIGSESCDHQENLTEEEPDF